MIALHEISVVCYKPESFRAFERQILRDLSTEAMDQALEIVRRLEEEMDQ